ncbi:hypothetical protein SUDANB13_02497 [Streptomyces sp. enrichment culture]|nr:hypothetical protein GCM10018789_54350 [Streptomyces werraensis]
MLRAFRWENWKQVSPYSSSLISGERTGIFREVWCGAGQAPGGPFAPGPRFWQGRVNLAGMSAPSSRCATHKGTDRPARSPNML